tara:strand:+ start:257 stop:508 length:252 start_codon:yes stop_codon:yes gene_type:complete
MTNWLKRDRPICLERRFEFETYDGTRTFLDKLGKLSESANVFPDISFGRTYVNITLRPESENKNAQLEDSDYKFASQIDELID